MTDTRDDIPLHDLMTTREAAALLRISKATLDRWRAEGRGPRYVRIGARVFYPRAELDRFLHEHLVETEHHGGS